MHRLRDGARVDAQLLRQHVPALLVGAERPVGLAQSGVRRHQQAVRTLGHRVGLVGPLRELHRVPEPVQLQRALRRVGQEVAAGRADTLAGCEHPVRLVGQRAVDVAAEERLRLSREADDLRLVALTGPGAGRVRERQERLDVRPHPGEREPVEAALDAVRVQRPADLGRRGSQARPCLRLLGPRPERLQQRLDPHRSPGGERQEPDQVGRLPRAPFGVVHHRAVSTPYLQPAQQPDLDASQSCAPPVHYLWPSRVVHAPWRPGPDARLRALTTENSSSGEC